MKFVYGLVLVFSISGFAQDLEAKKKEVIKEQEAKIAKIKASAGKNELNPQQKFEISQAENHISFIKKWDPSMLPQCSDCMTGGFQGGYNGGHAGGYPGGIQGGYNGGFYAGGIAGGHAGGYPGGIAGGAMTGGIAGGHAGGYPGGIQGGYVGGAYPANSLWNCLLSPDEKEITCANGKKYKQTEDSDESDRSEVYKQQWIPNVLEIEKKKAKQE
jgi:hypothetical protein